MLHQRLHREEHGAVDVIDKVQRGQNNERSGSPTPNPLRIVILVLLVLGQALASLSVCCFVCVRSYFFRGQRASTSVPMPPRGRNCPRTSHQTGFVAFTTSARI